MPSVLIELGFLSNKEEGEFLNSEEGQDKMARQIADAIIQYKKEYYNEAYNNNENVKYIDMPPVKKEVVDTVIAKAENTEVTDFKDGEYKIQLFASSKKRALTSPDFKGLKNISFTFENNLYKYFYGKSADLNEAKRLYQDAKNHGFKDAFIVTIVGGKTSALK